MDYAKVIRLPQYFRNMQRLGDIVGVLIKHGFGDLVDRLNLFSYLETGLRLLRPSLIPEKTSTLDFGTRLRLVCEDLGPTFIKFAQLIASRPDMFPDSVTREFRKLQDKVPPFPFEQARALIEEELGRPMNEIFSSFEETPLAAASIAQVHRATLSSGKRVVVKVQRPNLHKIIERDIDILHGIAALVEDNIPESRTFSPSRLVEEFARSLKSECDFRREAASIKRLAENFAGDEDLIVPLVFSDYSSDRVITEEYIEGIKADDLKGAMEAGIDRKAAAAILNRVVLKSIFEHRFFHADPHPGNVLLTADSRVALVDFGAMGRLDSTRLQYVLRFLVAIFSRDVDKILAVLHETEIAPRSIDEISLKNQISEILDIYLGQKLGQLDLARLLADVFEVARRYGIRPPPDLLLVGKAITTIEHIGAQLDPEFDPLQTIKPYLIKRYVAQRTDPRNYASYLSDLSDSYWRLMSELPVELRSILRSISRDSLSFGLSDRDLQQKVKHQNSMLNRALMTAAGITFLTLGVMTGFTMETRLHIGAAYGMIAFGVFILLLVWLAVRKTGGAA